VSFLYAEMLFYACFRDSISVFEYWFIFLVQVIGLSGWSSRFIKSMNLFSFPSIVP